MKIVIHSLAELLELTALIKGGSVTHSVGDIKCEVSIESGADAEAVAEAVAASQRRAAGDTCNGLTGTANLRTGAVTLDEEFEAKVPSNTSNESGEPGTRPAVDADGVLHNTDWHSDPPKLNARTGTWRARRKRDEDAYQAWLLAGREADAAAADAAVGNAEPEPEGVATETHALPQSEPQSEPEADATQNVPRTPGPDLAALVEASREAAQDASDDMRALLVACQDFVSKYSTTAFQAVKNAVAPLEGSETGVAVQSLGPDQRQLMRACMDNYALFV